MRETYSKSELKEFKEIIISKIKNTKKTWLYQERKYLMIQTMEPKTLSFKAFEEGSNTVKEENVLRKASKIYKGLKCIN